MHGGSRRTGGTVTSVTHALPLAPLLTQPDLLEDGRRYPEWHTLRLFGRGRRLGSFERGHETDRDLWGTRITRLSR
jgi:hypothetical protein